ncbi:arginine repressor [Bacteroides sp. 214]|uniref:arginine repressor n=1 Tax=Bacteroides sp. 214 TaxID=2302935 RepID=UPI0013D378F4|nr:arginine repressor [Bacteroides sp. 214]NDW12608.1 arginine repressor [Bacteroides sp. 214]
MKQKANRLEAIKMLISSKEMSNQDELLKELAAEGFKLTQATLSRDLKQLKVAKAITATGEYIYVLPNNIMYRRFFEESTGELPVNNGFISLRFSRNIAVVKTKPGYASMIAFDIDNRNYAEILGTVAGDDTIILVLAENLSHERASDLLSFIIPPRLY